MKALGVAAFAALVSPAAMAFENEPTAFRGIEWATPIEQLKQDLVVAREEGPRAFYERKGDKMTIGDASLESVTYIFYKGRFSAAFVRTEEGIAHQRALRDAMKAQFGLGTQPNRYIERWFWFGPTARISLNCATQRRCVAMFQSRAMSDEENQDKEAAANAAKKDF